MFKILKEIFSVNKIYSGKVRYNKKFYDWRESFCYELHKEEKKFEKIRKKFNPKTDSFVFTITRFIPKDTFYKKDGAISQKSGDLTNHEKPIVDAIFIEELSKKFINGIFFRNLEIDDTFIIDVNSKKRPTRKKQEFLEIDIQIVNNKTFK